MASRELKSTDVGAPQLVGNTKNSLNAVLKAALVNGYGETAPLGWDLIYEELDQGVCVFRPKIGSRMFLQIIDDNSFGNGRVAKAQSYESMQSAFIGVMPCNPDNVTYVHKISTNSSALSVPWHIIGDERGFYLLTRPYYNSSTWKNISKICYFGEGVSVEDPDYTSKYNWLQWTNEIGANYNSITQTMTVYVMRHPVTKMKGSLMLTTMHVIGGLGTNDAFYIGARCNGSIGGTYGYTPIRNQVRNNIFSCNFPGLFEPLFSYGVSYKQQQIIYEEIDDYNTIASFPCGGLFNNSTTKFLDARISFLIGDKFRDVF